MMTVRTERTGGVFGLELLIALLLIGCSERTPEGPQVQAITPASGRTNSSTVVRIGGRFNPTLIVDYDDESRSRLSFEFRAQLGERELSGVIYRSGTELEATVPAGLAAGVYDLRVLDPRGRAGVLTSAFTVIGALDGGSEAGPREAGAEAGGNGRGSRRPAAMRRTPTGASMRARRDGPPAERAPGADAPRQVDAPAPDAAKPDAARPDAASPTRPGPTRPGPTLPGRTPRPLPIRGPGPSSG